MTVRWIAMLASGLALLAAPSLAQENRFYASVSGLYVMPNDSEVESETGGYTLSSNLSMESGYGFTAAAGYGADIGLRGELELGYRSGDFEKFQGYELTGQNVNVGSDRPIPYKGSFSILTVMANGIFVAEIWKLRPYFGGGIGVGFAKAEEDAQTLILPVGQNNVEVPSEGDEGEDTVIVYQAMLGIAYPLSEAAEARLGYRYFAAAEGDYSGMKANFSSHDVEVGIRFAF